jgi:FAD binding domain/Berberine and berberine like
MGDSDSPQPAINRDANGASDTPPVSYKGGNTVPTTRRDFFLGAAPAAMAGALGFPAVLGGQAHAATLRASGRPGQPGSGAATNGYLWSLLDQTQLRQLNVNLTQLAIQQCSLDEVANQIEFDTLICQALTTFLAQGVSSDDLVTISQNYDVLFRWSLMYGDARATFNARFVRMPLAIAFPRTVDDVVFWVNFVRDHGFSVSIRSGNNCYESFSIDNEIIIDLTFLTLEGTTDQFQVDLSAGVVHVAPGVRLGVLYTALAQSGVRIGGGQCSPVCIGGLTGTGGVGYSTRELGYMCDQLVEVEYVLANGQVVVANAANQYADLYRATKGAGAAGLGVMTRLTVQLVPAVTVLFYTVAFNLLDAARVLESWQNLAVLAPDALSSVANLPNASPLTGPAQFFVIGEYPVSNGDVDGAKQELTRILRSAWLNLVGIAPVSFNIQALTTTEAATAVAVAVPQPALNQWKLKSYFSFRRLTALELQPFINFLLNNAPADDPTKAVGAFTLLLAGGKAARIDPNSAVVPARGGTVAWFHGGALWNDQALEPQCLAWVDSAFDILKPLLSQTAQYGVPDRQLGSQLTQPPDFGYLKAYWTSPTANFVPFLLLTKQRYDPQDVFRFAQSIPVNFLR